MLVKYIELTPVHAVLVKYIELTPVYAVSPEPGHAPARRAVGFLHRLARALASRRIPTKWSMFEGMAQGQY